MSEPKHLQGVPRNQLVEIIVRQEKRIAQLESELAERDCLAQATARVQRNRKTRR